MLARHHRRRLAMGLATVLGLAERGFFLPYRYAASVRPIAYPGLKPLFESAEPAFADIITRIETLSPSILALPQSQTGARLDQAWFPGLDALAAYSLIREGRTRKIIEVGSGHSTRFMAAAILDGGSETSLTCIDPVPRAALDHLNMTWHRSVLQAMPVTAFEALEEDDVLFIDSSHLLMPGTDVDYLIGHILPVLRAGVLLHIHDIFLPDPYPESWAWRGYNEQSAIAALVQGGGYDLVFASHYVGTRMAASLKAAPFGDLDIGPTSLQSSLWLRKR